MLSLSTYQKPKNTGTIKISLKAFKYHMGERTLSMEVKNKNPKKTLTKNKTKQTDKKQVKQRQESLTNRKYKKAGIGLIA